MDSPSAQAVSCTRRDETNRKAKGKVTPMSGGFRQCDARTTFYIIVIITITIMVIIIIIMIIILIVITMIIVIITIVKLLLLALNSESALNSEYFRFSFKHRVNNFLCA